MERLTNHTTNLEIGAQRKREQFREDIFPQLVATHILEHIADDLLEAGFEKQEIREIQHVFLDLSEKEMKAVLAIPAQLRPKLFERYAEQLEEGSQTPAGMVKDLLQKSEKYHYTLGYHLSPKEIKPDAQGNWVVKGTEKDHRHNDIPMAYYSLDYRNRYREKPSKFLYIVRAEQVEGSGHYQDNNGLWGHAPSLSVVDVIDLPNLEKEMDILMDANEKGETV
jgi:hypothetical protein